MKDFISSITYENGRRITVHTTETSRTEDCAMLSKYYELLAKQYALLENNPGNQQVMAEIQSTQDYINTYTEYLNGYERKDDDNGQKD